MKTMADLHIHTNYSPDSSVKMQQYIDVALQRGVGVLCFTDHVDCTKYDNNFDEKMLLRRLEEFLALKKQYQGKLKLLIGVEFGEPHQNPKQFEFVKQLPLDMIIGSIHYPLDKYLRSNHDGFDCVKLYNTYVGEMLEFGGFDVLGHIDMPKRYQQFIENYTEYPIDIEQNLKLCIKQGIVPEINTSTLRRGVDQTMPSLKMVEFYQKCGGKFVTINSDSHNAFDLATNFETTQKALPKGIECCYFEGRKLIPLQKTM